MLGFSIFDLPLANPPRSDQVIFFFNGSIMPARSIPIPLQESQVNLTPTTSNWSLTPYGLSQFVYIDNNVSYDGQPSLRVQPDYDYPTELQPTANDRAVYSTAGHHGFFTANADEQIVFSAWVMTSSSSMGHDGLSDHGARIGIDFYSASGRIGNSPPDVPSTASGSFIPWGTNKWTQLLYIMKVPSGYGIIGFIPWLQVIDPIDSGNAWYANIQLNIDPFL